MLILELVSVLFSILSVLLLMRNSIHTWTFGLVGIIGYMLIFYINGLYSNTFLQIIFIILSVIGYLEWNKVNDKKTNIKWIDSTIIHLLIFSLLYTFTKFFTHNPLPLLDSLATTLSLFATYLMIVKSRLTWLFWIIADIVYVILFFNQSLFLSMWLYGVFLVLSIIGYLRYEKV